MPQAAIRVVVWLGAAFFAEGQPFEPDALKDRGRESGWKA
jgi:hypothetical protein